MADSNSKGGVEIVTPELSINKKLGKIKFDQAFDSGVVDRAERVVVQSERVFKNETVKDYEDLKQLFLQVDPNNMSAEMYKSISELAFSIKSRAATGGFPLASEVANSMFKFCDAALSLSNEIGYKVVKLHYNALVQVFEEGFAHNDPAKGQKLVAGLEEVSRRFLAQGVSNGQ